MSSKLLRKRNLAIMGNDEKLDASEVVVNFKDENGKISRVSVADLLNELFTALFKLEEDVKQFKTGKKESPIITLDKLVK